ncbi:MULTISPECIES: type II toxin-antitoxin system HipA family toxin [Brevundimonas]|jgi:serine/threonine-protein kinase HipA|uniref:type II toxin-antitoxin system HipA family toxin n=1 Tax=Brevundimonas TaxID=41275 RepID=UPI00036C988D|nr:MULTISPECIES: type II toxin-antitoxin system HipA family toxin [Brevundimonas]MCC4295872.1 type II toxin-antitoxin system HipA family toxin [Brevundimonas aurantiaca]
MTLAAVNLWGRRIGAVSLAEGADVATFAYEPAFVRSQIEVAPLFMPLGDRIYSFPGLNPESFYGLPGLLADALPDRYGHTLIDAWLATQGRTPDSFDAVERLCYMGARGMGALEFTPAAGPRTRKSERIHIESLVQLASEVLSNRNTLQVSFADPDKAAALHEILQVGTSAGGARAKAVIAWNPETNEVRSGQVEAGDGFGYWLLKFDGVSNNKDRGLADPQGYGAVEFAYSEMAKAAGISMTDCRLLPEGGRRHFMTRRFDRTEAGGKLHMQSLAALAHYDYCSPDSYTYEQAFQVMRRLGLPMDQMEELFRRMTFNVVARNQDDHVKNIAFLMDREGVWSLAPAYDVTWAMDPTNKWLRQHQMSVNGRRDDFTRADLEACAATASINAARARAIIDEVVATVTDWPGFAEAAEVDEAMRASIDPSLRVNL